MKRLSTQEIFLIFCLSVFLSIAFAIYARADEPQQPTKAQYQEMLKKAQADEPILRLQLENTQLRIMVLTRTIQDMEKVEADKKKAEEVKSKEVKKK